MTALIKGFFFFKSDFIFENFNLSSILLGEGEKKKKKINLLLLILYLLAKYKGNLKLLKVRETI